MQISTNLIAKNTYNKFKKQNEKVQDSQNRLSSGKRINQAADDAAGMAISEKLKSQVKGANQARKNIQDGNSLAQTAEGGLKEIQDILQQVRELTIRAANDTLTKEDRQEIQQEVDQMKEEVDAIANNTEFNEKKLLTSEVQEINDPPENTEKPKVDIVFHIDYSSTTSDEIEYVKSGINSFIDELGKMILMR